MNSLEISATQIGNEIDKRKMEILKKCLKAIGKESYFDTMYSRFPKIAGFAVGKWTVYFVDDESKSGKFVCAFGDESQEYKWSKDKLVIECTINWTDKEDDVKKTAYF